MEVTRYMNMRVNPTYICPLLILSVRCDAFAMAFHIDNVKKLMYTA
jgi:hypothetical protein